MGTSIARHLSPDEVERLQATKASAERMNSGIPPGTFIFFAAFDGTNNDKNNLPQTRPPLLDTIYQTNVANLFDQANFTAKNKPSLRTGYYPGVGTGGEHGNWVNSSILPTAPLRASADLALQEFAREAHKYLQANPGATYRDLSASMVSFSRGAATAMVFAHKIEEEGLVLDDGTQVAPPGAVPITSNVMLDPVTRFVDEDLSLPSNVRGRTLLLAARDEWRSDFRLADYARDPRVMRIDLAGNHCGVGGGYDLQGTSAIAAEISTAYLQNSGIELAPVRAELRFDPRQRIAVYSENHQIARNGDVVGSQEHPSNVWRVDTGHERQSASVPAPIVVPQVPQSRLDEPGHPGHAMFKQAQEAMRKLDAQQKRTPDHRSDQAAAAITAQAYKDGLRQINGIAPATDGSRLFAIDGTPGSVLSKLSSVPTMTALDTPIVQSTQAYEMAVQQSQQQALERTMRQDLQPNQPTHSGPIMSR